MEAQVAEPFEVVLRGFSPQELTRSAQRRCAEHFGTCPFRVDETRCVPCICSLGGRVRLYEARLVARPLQD